MDELCAIVYAIILFGMVSYVLTSTTIVEYRNLRRGISVPHIGLVLLLILTEIVAVVMVAEATRPSKINGSSDAAY